MSRMDDPFDLQRFVDAQADVYDDACAGWITLTRDNEPMRELATALHINLRLGSDVG